MRVHRQLSFVPAAVGSAALIILNFLELPVL